MCDRLYHGFDLSVWCNEPLGIGEVSLAAAKEDEFQIGEFRDEALEEIRYKVAKSLFCLEDRSRWKERCYSDEETLVAVKGRFDHGHMGKTSDGWTYSEEYLDECHDQEQMDMEMNRLGF